MPWWLLAAAPAGILAASWLRWRSKMRQALVEEARQALRDGDLSRAATRFEALAGDGGDRVWVLELARVEALRGNIDRAIALAGRARRATRERAIDAATSEARLTLVDALIATRRGEFAEAALTLTQRWAIFESAHDGWLAEACLIRGFAASQIGGSVESWLGLSDAARARVRWLSADWPALRAFLDANERS